MSNPYESAFGDEKNPDINESSERKPIDFSGLPPMDEFMKKALDELLDACRAQGALQILAEALEATVKRMQQYVNARGENNISASELALLSRDRLELTDGAAHNFNYFFLN